MKLESKQSVQHVEITQQADGQRIDNFLISALKGVPKGHIYRIIRKGEVRVNKGRIKNVYRLKTGDIVRIPPINLRPETEKAKPSQGLLAHLKERIVHQDEDFMVINKPSGLAVHGGTQQSMSLIDALTALFPEEQHLELVHRLDKATSGCILIAKNRKMLNALQTMLRRKTINKTYQALLYGQLHRKRVEVKAPLQKRKLPTGEHRVRIHPEGKPSETTFKVIRHFPSATLVEASPKTGRTHQIRVHAKHIQHPIAGDQRYAQAHQLKSFEEKGLKRLFLHASQLQFKHPVTQQELSFTAPLDDELTVLLENL